MATKLIDYTNLLHKYRDSNHPKVKDFYRENTQGDPLFEKRAKKLNALFKKVASVKSH